MHPRECRRWKSSNKFAATEFACDKEQPLHKQCSGNAGKRRSHKLQKHHDCNNNCNDILDKLLHFRVRFAQLTCHLLWIKRPVFYIKLIVFPQFNGINKNQTRKLDTLKLKLKFSNRLAAKSQAMTLTELWESEEKTFASTHLELQNLLFRLIRINSEVPSGKQGLPNCTRERTH